MELKNKTLQLAIIVLSVMATIVACTETVSNQSETKKEDITEIRKKEKAELIARGKYLVTVSGCNDCHSPKIMTPMGPVPDSTRLMSGYPSEKGIPVLSEALAKDQSWVKMSHDATAFVGPWGMTFGANLTPDETTGIGNWTEQAFVQSIRTGKHLGQEGGRQVMPPMPWYMIAKMTDEDLSAVYEYLMSLPAITNQVPVPIPPTEIKTVK